MIGNYKTILLKTKNVVWRPTVLDHTIQVDGNNCGIYCLKVKTVVYFKKVVRLVIIHVTDCRSISKNCRKWSPKNRV